MVNVSVTQCQGQIKGNQIIVYSKCLSLNETVLKWPYCKVNFSVTNHDIDQRSSHFQLSFVFPLHVSVW